MLREYEITIVFNPQLSPDLFKKTSEKYEKILLADGGEVIKKDDWGVKKLGYPMKKHFRGRYVHYDLTSTPTNLKEAERLLRIDENVLRYLDVLVSKNVDVEKRKVELAKAEAIAAAGQNAGL